MGSFVCNICTRKQSIRVNRNRKQKAETENRKAMKARVFLSTLMLLTASTLLSGAATAKGREARITVSMENATEAGLTIENWMINECYWKCMEYNCFARDYDETLALEPWMTNAALWEREAYTAETESSLELEPWMTDLEARNADLFIPLDQEAPLVLESWMSGVETWEALPYTLKATEEPMTLEPWMTSEKCWGPATGKDATAEK